MILISKYILVEIKTNFSPRFCSMHLITYYRPPIEHRVGLLIKPSTVRCILNNQLNIVLCPNREYSTYKETLQGIIFKSVVVSKLYIAISIAHKLREGLSQPLH